MRKMWNKILKLSMNRILDKIEEALVPCCKELKMSKEATWTSDGSLFTFTPFTQSHFITLSHCHIYDFQSWFLLLTFPSAVDFQFPSASDRWLAALGKAQASLALRSLVLTEPLPSGVTERNRAKSPNKNNPNYRKNKGTGPSDSWYGYGKEWRGSD